MKSKIILVSELDGKRVEIIYANRGDEATVMVDGKEVEFAKDEYAFKAPILAIIKEYKDGWDDPLDSDEVDRLVEHLRNRINLQEGNITEEEYLELESN